MDRRWPRASDWLAAGPADRSVDVAILGVPTFATSMSNSGTHAAPAAIRRALGHFSTWSSSRRIDLTDMVAPWDRGDVEDPDIQVEGEWRIRTAAQTAVAKSRLLIALGGDNALTYPTMAGCFGDQLARAGLVTLDAQHDVRDGRSNLTPVRDLIEAGLPAERIVQVGIADWSNGRSYTNEAHARGVGVIGRQDVARRGVEVVLREALDVAGAGGGGIYVALDLGACDRAVVPACVSSLPGGLSASDVLEAAFVAGRDPRVVALDLTEVDVSRDSDDQRTVRLAAMCVLEAACGLALREAL